MKNEHHTKRINDTDEETAKHKGSDKWKGTDKDKDNKTETDTNK